MPFPLIPLIAGLAGMGGQAMANRANRGQAREQMAFQERMAGTSAQRAKADFEAAGLNPALAYGTQAASPQGAFAKQEDSFGSGVGSAMAIKQGMANVALTEAQTQKTQNEGLSAYADAALKVGATTPDEPTWRDEQMAKRRASMRDMEFRGTMQPHERALLQARRSLEESRGRISRFSEPGAKNQADVERWMGAMKPALQFGLNSAGSLSRIPFVRRF